MGFNAWNTFVLRVEHPYIVHCQKVGEITGYGSLVPRPIQKIGEKGLGSTVRACA